MRKSHRHLQCLSRRLARSEQRQCFVKYQTQHRANLMHQPAKVTQMISIMDHFFDRHDQRDHLSQTSSSDSTQLWSQRPILATSLVGTFTTFVGSNRLSRFVVVGYLSLFTAVHFQSLPLWFSLLSRRRKEAVRSLTKLRNTQARRQSESQKAKEFSRWLQCDIKRAHR